MFNEAQVYQDRMKMIDKELIKMKDKVKIENERVNIVETASALKVILNLIQ